MVVNSDKTEVVTFGPTIDMDLQIKGTPIAPSSEMKVLGVILDHRLSWIPHIENVKKKAVRVINGIKLLRRKLTKAQCITICTAQLLSILYYGAAVWMTPHLCAKAWKKIESIHYKALRLVLRDYRQRISRSVIDQTTNRLPPKRWAKFTAGSFAIKVYYNNKPNNLRKSIFANTYTKNRSPGTLFGYDSSRSKAGRQITCNWIGQVLSNIKEDWTNSVRSNDAIRVLLKKTFY